MQIKFNNITKHFSAIKALKGVSFEIGPGEILGLLGENGAGKSTLMNILGGVLPPTSGSIEIDGVEYTSMDTDTAFSLGISFIHQELNLVNDLKVYENLFLNHEITRFGFLDKNEMIKKTKAVFSKMGLDINPEAYIKDIDTSRKQLVEIAKALLYDSKVIIFDEPTTALTETEIKTLFKLMREFKKDGISSIYISHKMPEIFDICDRYVVLRDGSFIQEGLIKDIDENIATELLVGKALDHDALYVTHHRYEDIVFEVKNLSSGNFFKNISFKVKEGEVVSITGLFGDGRGELSEALFGARPLSSGEIFIHNKKVDKVNIPTMIKSGISMVPRDRKERSIISDMNIGNNLSLPYFKFKKGAGLISAKLEKERFEKNKRIFSIKAPSYKDEITSLSGGNQQKVVFARWFELDSDIYILDNPTQGIDVGAKGEIYELISDLSKQGKSIIVFSSEFPEIQKISHRCIVMYQGEINKIIDNKNLNEMDVMYYSTGSNKKEARNEDKQERLQG